MSDSPLTYELLETRLTIWAQTQPAVRAVLVVGSRARGDADAWSDMDVLLFTTERDRYAADALWLRNFGDLWLAYSEPTALGDPEWYAVYDGGLKLDVVMIQIDDPALDLETLMQPLPYQGVFGRGVRVLFDRNHVPRVIPPKLFVPDAPPTSDEFSQVVSGFLMASATTAKFISRGDFWRAQNWFAADLRPHLLTMLHWQAHGQDTWYGGRFMEQWADPRALASLPVCFPAFERESLQTSLLGILELFRVISEETASKFGYVYPTDAHNKIETLVRMTLNIE